MDITIQIALLSNEQKNELTELMQEELEFLGFEEQDEINEIIANGLDGRLCDLEELIPRSVILKMAS